MLLQADKDNYRGFLMALRWVTGLPLSVSAEERKYVPTGIEVVTPEKDTKPVKDKDKGKDKDKDKPKP